MAEFTGVFVQQIAANGNAVFSETPVSGSNCIVHREGSGIITLRGMTNQCRARYKVVFGGNIAIPTGGAVGPISVAIAVEGEALGSATAIVTPAAVNEFFNVFAAAFIAVSYTHLDVYKRQSWSSTRPVRSRWRRPTRS